MLTKINGRLKFYSRISSVIKTRPGHYDVVMGGRTYHVEGGKPAGGSSRDWFVDGFGSKGIPCTSLLDALHIIENA